MAERGITSEEQQTVAELVARARAAMAQAVSFDQTAVDRLCRAIAWAGGEPLWVTTYGHIPWDRPFYERHGFLAVPPFARPPGGGALLSPRPFGASFLG